MKRAIIGSACLVALSTLATTAMATEYPFPVNMQVTIERGDNPILKSNSSVVYPIVNKFTVTMPNGDVDFVLENEAGDEIKMVKDGSEYLLQSSVAVGENIFFGPNLETAGKPIRVVLEGPITLGHVHFSTNSTRLNEEARYVLGEMAQQMMNSGLMGAYLVGMTDRSGSDAANLSLSLRRANSAAKYLNRKLTQLGAEGPKVTVENMGEYLSSAKAGIVDPYDRKVSVMVYPLT
jgi:outer membrane protein OmpA-like peptidoglycan-associated protein